MSSISEILQRLRHIQQAGNVGDAVDTATAVSATSYLPQTLSPHIPVVPVPPPSLPADVDVFDGELGSPSLDPGATLDGHVGDGAQGSEVDATSISRTNAYKLINLHAFFGVCKLINCLTYTLFTHFFAHANRDIFRFSRRPK